MANEEGGSGFGFAGSKFKSSKSIGGAGSCLGAASTFCGGGSRDAGTLTFALELLLLLLPLEELNCPPAGT